MKIILLFLITTLFACTTTRQGSKSGHYAEPHRPQFHFSPEKMWMNDPNGMVYYEGEYHLFYQYYPNDIVWGPMHWGHAVSSDLVHWEHLPIALYPDSLGYIFSGSAVVDWNNTSGFGKNGKPPLVAMFTHHNMAGEKAGKMDFQYQSLAYSNDKGRTWTKYEGNPVIPNPGTKDFRDTKVFWHEPSGRWVVVFAAGDRVVFYNSSDLKNWSKTGEFGVGQGGHGGVWECPDLFELPVQFSNEKKWVLLLSINPGGPNGGSATQYFTGIFDGKTFKNANPPEQVLWLDHGTDNYAGVTWSDAPSGRRLFMGWMSNWNYAQQVPTAPWRSAMTVPRELSLRRTPQGLRLAAYPVPELKKLGKKGKHIKPHVIEGQLNISKKNATHDITLEIDLVNTTATEFGVKLSNALGEEMLIGYETATKRFYMDRTKSGKMAFSDKFPGRHFAPRTNTNGILALRLLTDVSSTELFADFGELNMTDVFFPTKVFNHVSLYAVNGKLALLNGEITALKGIW